MSAAAITLISELIAVAEQLGGAYQRIRALSLQVGVTDAQLQEADARFAKIVGDPLAVHTTTPPTPPDPSTARYTTKDDAIAAAEQHPGWKVFQLPPLPDGTEQYVISTVGGLGVQVWP